jgi:hypothetical protein
MVIYKCRELGNPVTETLAAYIAQTTMNPQSGRFYLEKQINQEEATILVENTIERLQQSEPSLSKSTSQTNPFQRHNQVANRLRFSICEARSVTVTEHH